MIELLSMRIKYSDVEDVLATIGREQCSTHFQRHLRDNDRRRKSNCRWSTARELLILDVFCSRHATITSSDIICTSFSEDFARIQSFLLKFHCPMKLLP